MEVEQNRLTIEEILAINKAKVQEDLKKLNEQCLETVLQVQQQKKINIESYLYADLFYQIFLNEIVKEGDDPTLFQKYFSILQGLEGYDFVGYGKITLLFEALLKGKYQIFKFLVVESSKKNDFEKIWKQEFKGLKIINNAVYYGKIQFLKLILKYHKVDFEVKDKYGETILQQALTSKKQFEEQHNKNLDQIAKLILKNQEAAAAAQEAQDLQSKQVQSDQQQVQQDQQQTQYQSQQFYQEQLQKLVKQQQDKIKFFDINLKIKQEVIDYLEIVQAQTNFYRVNQMPNEEQISNEEQKINFEIPSYMVDIFSYRKIHDMSQYQNAPALCSVGSFNLLADCFCQPNNWPYVNQNYLKFNYRKHLIIQAIKKLDSDVICLQELDNFEEYYKQAFESLGYQVAEYVNPIFEGQLTKIGIGIAFKKEKFVLENQIQIEFNKTIPEELTQHLLPIKGYYSKNVGQIIELKMKSSNNNNKLIIGNCHIKYDPLLEHVKYYQIAMMLKTMNNQKQISENNNELAYIFLAGDFNSLQNSNQINLVTDKLNKPILETVPIEYQIHVQLNDEQVIYDYVKEQLKIDFASSYSNYENNSQHPKYTNYTLGFKETIDYIFYSKNNLIAVQLLEIPEEDKIKAEPKGLPSQNFPSDHFPLNVHFILK